ncbi:hypothetical protein, partial [Nocardioides sp. SYSU DS0651]|uniref:hypothetical protein n=1 Tax=Nocardioides sp. SYSU DS0651 TaxID=3415955 RepID=UPI003F4B8B18
MTAASADEWTRAVVVPGPGEGTLARIGPVVLLVGSTDPDVVKPYLEHARMVAANGGQGRQLVRGYALMLSTAVDQSPGFAALAPHTTGLAVFVDGDVRVTVDDQEISGADSLAWVERLIPWPVGAIRVTLAGAEAPADGSSYRLDGGVVPAGSFSVASLDVAGADGGSMVAAAPPVQPTDQMTGDQHGAEETGEMPAASQPAASQPAAPEPAPQPAPAPPAAAPPAPPA